METLRSQWIYVFDGLALAIALCCSRFRRPHPSDAKPTGKLNALAIQSITREWPYAGCYPSSAVATPVYRITSSTTIHGWPPSRIQRATFSLDLRSMRTIRRRTAARHLGYP